VPAQIPLAAHGGPWWYVRLQPTEDHARAEIHAASHGEPHTVAGGCALKEAAARGELTQQQVFWQLWPVGHPRWSSLFLKACTPWEGPMLEQFLKNCNLWGGNPCWSSKKVTKRMTSRSWSIFQMSRKTHKQRTSSHSYM